MTVQASTFEERAPGMTRGAALATVVASSLLAAALALLPSAGALHPVQHTVVFKQLTGYALVALLGFLLLLGVWRGQLRRPGPAAVLMFAHQVAGLAMLVLVAGHVGAAPSGYLRAVLLLVLGTCALGALRQLAAGRLPPRALRGLAVAHIAMGCLIASAALVHIYFVYAYTA